MSLLIVRGQIFFACFISVVAIYWVIDIFWGVYESRLYKYCRTWLMAWLIVATTFFFLMFSGGLGVYVTNSMIILPGGQVVDKTLPGFDSFYRAAVIGYTGFVLCLSAVVDKVKTQRKKILNGAP